MSWINAKVPITRYVLNWSKTKRTYALLTAILDASEYNSAIVVEDIQIENGKKRQFRVTYYPADCSPAGTCNANICDAGTPIEPKQAIYELTQCTASAVRTLNMNDVRDFDGKLQFSDHAKQAIAAQLPEMRKLLATDILSYVIPHMGLLPGGHTSRRVSMADPRYGSANLAGKNEIDRVFEDTGFNNPFLIGGSSEIYNWKKAVGVGATNALGQQVDQFDDTNMYYDTIVNDVFGDGGQHIIAFDPQVMKFVSWSANAGIFATDPGSIDDLDNMFRRVEGNLIVGSLLDPVTGLVWDLELYFDACAKRWNWKYQLEWDVFFMDDLACNDPGVNGIFHFTTCAPVILPCPEGDAYPTPEALIDYTATFPTDPTYVGVMVVDGKKLVVDAVLTTGADWAGQLSEVYTNAGFISPSGSVVTYSGYTAHVVSWNNGTGTRTFTVVTP